MMYRKTFEECETDVERWLFLFKNIENMESKPKGYPEFDELFEAADMSHLANEEVVAYSQSRQKILDDREGVRQWGEIVVSSPILGVLEQNSALYNTNFGHFLPF